MNKKFGTKAETLEMLAKIELPCVILPQVRFTIEEWRRNSKEILKEVGEKFPETPLIVRSSALTEDLLGASQAGQFESVLNVSFVTLASAIDRVFASYDSDLSLNQVFVQPMVKKVMMSGVAFTADPNTGSPYYIINYDKSTLTDQVTSGASNNIATAVIFKFKKLSLSAELDSVVTLLEALETHFGKIDLDVEFAIGENREVYLLQVRPLRIKENKNLDFQNDLTSRLEGLYQRISASNSDHPYLLGKRTLYGVMPDWNPAEIIGVRPRPLAMSLYKDLVTDSIWAYQRDNYGYRNLRSFPLMQSFYGMPYIDVRVDFNSFIPSDIDNKLADKLANYYLDSLSRNPGLHDKVEFEILFSCYTFDLRERLKVLENHGFNPTEIDTLIQSLNKLTLKILDPETGLWKHDAGKLEILEGRRDEILGSNLPICEKIYWLLEDCKRYGTLPFAGLARAAFIAVQVLRSLVSLKVLSDMDYQRFMESLETVNSQMSRDFCAMSKPDFLKKYGHLRPGTYDILSPRYDEDADRYFDWSQTRAMPKDHERRFVLRPEQIERIDELLQNSSLGLSATQLFDFIKSTIEWRETSKFIFTKSISSALSLMKQVAEEAGVSLDDMSYCDCSAFKEMAASASSFGDIAQRWIKLGRDTYSLTQTILLPPLIEKPDDVWAFHVPPCEPNFITLKRTTGHVTSSEKCKSLMKGSVFFIPSADPGFDWIFSQDISAFVTMYGGVNSHMAIRAGELGIPAIIGAGELLYNKWSQGQVLEIDCNNRQVNILR